MIAQAGIFSQTNLVERVGVVVWMSASNNKLWKTLANNMIADKKLDVEQWFSREQNAETLLSYPSNVWLH